MASLLFPKWHQFELSTGAPAASYWLHFLTTGTSTAKDAYSDVSASTPIANPYQLNSAGRPAANIYISGTYRVVLHSTNDLLTGTSIADVDPVEDGVRASAFQANSPTYGGNNSGTATALVFTMSPAVTSYTGGSVFRGRITADITGPATINWGGGVKSLVKQDGTALVSGDAQGPGIIEWVYDPTTDVARLLSPDGHLFRDGSNASIAFGHYRVLGNDSKNNAGTPDTQFDLDADSVILYNPTTMATIARINPGAAITNNVSTAGPAANGRDQSGAFTAGSWVHFYWIWNGTTLATLSSATAPPTGPALPTGYTHWAYCCAVRFSGGSALLKTRVKGARAYYEASQVAVADGTASAETAVDVSAIVPPNALSYTVSVVAFENTAANNLRFRVVSGTEYLPIIAMPAGSDRQVFMFEFPNVSRQFYYMWTGTNASTDLDVNVISYVLPNGGE